MRISNDQVGRMLEVQLPRSERAERAASAPTDARAGDRLQDQAAISQRAEEIRLALAAARAPLPRDERFLDRLAQEVRAGRYRAPAEEVAEAILRELRG